MFTLNYIPPYDWKWMTRFLASRAIAGVETIADGQLSRTLRFLDHSGYLTVTPEPEYHRCKVVLSDGLMPVAEPVLAQVRRWLDIDMNPGYVAQVLGPLASDCPGLRLPGCLDAFEQIVRAILGQLVSVSMAARLTSRLVQALGTQTPNGWLFPEADALAGADPRVLKSLGMSLRRAQAIVALAGACRTGQFPCTAPENIDQGIRTLTAFSGVGRWTANYFALRGWSATDVFLEDDYLIKQRFVGMTPGKIRQYAQRWAPLRSYALLHIWHSPDWRPDQLMAK